MAKTLTAHPGPDLSKVGPPPPRLDRRLAGGAGKVRPGTAMPALFADDDNGRVERYAVAHYLASLGGPVAVNPKPPGKKDEVQSRGPRRSPLQHHRLRGLSRRG